MQQTGKRDTGPEAGIFYFESLQAANVPLDLPSNLSSLLRHASTLNHSAAPVLVENVASLAGPGPLPMMADEAV